MKKAWLLAAISCIGPFVLQIAAPQAAAAASRSWTRTYNGPSSGYDLGNAVALGPDGNIYVAGENDNAGEGTNLLLRKYSPGGALRWARAYNGPDNAYDNGAGVAVAPDGNVYVAGTTQTGTGAEELDLLVQKYSPGGAVLWTKTLDLAGRDDFGQAVAAGPDGSVYVAGRTRVGSTWELLLQKFSAAGDPLWTRSYPGIHTGPDAAWGVATDSDGSVYVVGQSSVTAHVGNGSIFLLQKYSDAGDLLWTETYAGGGGNDYGTGVAVAPDHSVVAVGTTTIAGHDNIMQRKYTADGNLVWATTTMGGATFYGYASGTGVSVSPDGGIALVGCVEPEGKSVRIFVGGYSAAGAALWTASYDGSGGGYDCGHGVAVGPGGGVFVTGEVEVSGQGWDLWLSKYR